LLVILSEPCPFLEARLVKAINVGEMDLKPLEPRLPHRLLDTEFEKSSAQVVPYRAEVRRDRVRPTSEVHVVRKVKRVVEI
jgi:hypothetical protein